MDIIIGATLAGTCLIVSLALLTYAIVTEVRERRN